MMANVMVVLVPPVVLVPWRLLESLDFGVLEHGTTGRTVVQPAMSTVDCRVRSKCFHQYSVLYRPYYCSEWCKYLYKCTAVQCSHTQLCEYCRIRPLFYKKKRLYSSFDVSIFEHSQPSKLQCLVFLDNNGLTPCMNNEG